MAKRPYQSFQTKQYWIGVTMKNIQSGLGWAFSDNLRNLLLWHHFITKPPTMLGVFLADYPTVCRALAFGALTLEVTAPLALFSRIYYRVVIPGLASLQFMIWVTLGVMFKEMALVFACLLPWDAWLTHADRLASSSLAAWRRKSATS